MAVNKPYYRTCRMFVDGSYAEGGRLRACVEIEANLTAILAENGYSKKDDLSMSDYRLVNRSHRLSSYEVRIPGWRETGSVRRPFAVWADGGKSLPWYKAYNNSKHNRHECFHEANFENLIDAVCGLVVVLSAQSLDEDYSPAQKVLGLEPAASYDADDGMESAIGNFFRVRFPIDWALEECYDFDWSDLEESADPLDKFPYA